MSDKPDGSYNLSMTHEHHHEISPAAMGPRLLASLAANAVITLLQVVGGILANSLGLLSDAAHNLSDVVALGLSYWALRLGRRPPTHRRTFAYKRAEILVALFNSTVLVGVSVYLIVEGVRRLADPEPVHGLTVMAFAAGGLVVNVIAALLVGSHHRDLNLRSAFLHLMGDAGVSLGVLLSGLVIYVWGWRYADPIVSILVSLWIGREAFEIIRGALNVLMEGTPEGIELAAVERAMLEVTGVKGIHDLHIWSISSNDLALSAHIEADDKAISEANAVLVSLKQMLWSEFGVGHVTFELECLGGSCAGGMCTLASTNGLRVTSAAGERHVRS